MRRTKTLPLKDVLQEYVEAMKMKGKLTEVSLLNSWEKTVGPTISRSTKDIYIKDKKLFVRINSSVIRSELLLIKDGLMSRLNENAGTQVILDIVFL